MRTGRGNHHGFLRAIMACLLFMMGLGLAAAPAKPAPPPAKSARFVIRYTTINKRRYLPLKSVAEYYKLVYRPNIKDKSVVLLNATGAKVAVFKANSRNFTLNGTAAGLSFPIVIHKDQFMLELTDFQDFIDPIMRPQSIPKRKIRTIMLDAGHGGKDTGAQAGGRNEKDINLLMVRRIGAILTMRGYTVLYTRTDDKFVELKDRSKAATKHKPDLFISIHCNAIAPEQADKISGIEVYVANAKGVPSYGGDVIGQDRPGAKFQSTNAYWAYLMQRSLLKATSAVDRGVKRKQLSVVAYTPVPAMLIELGFLTHKEEFKKMTTPAYQDKLAVAICDGVNQIEKALRPPNTKGPVPLKKAPTKPAAPAAKPATPPPKPPAPPAKPKGK